MVYGVLLLCRIRCKEQIDCIIQIVVDRLQHLNGALASCKAHFKEVGNFFLPRGRTGPIYVRPEAIREWLCVVVKCNFGKSDLHGFVNGCL